MFRSRRKCTARGKPFDGKNLTCQQDVFATGACQQVVTMLLFCQVATRLSSSTVDMFMFKHKYVHSWVSGFTRQPIARLTEDPRYLRLNVFIREDVKILLFTDVNVTFSIVTLNRGPTKP